MNNEPSQNNNGEAQPSVPTPMSPPVQDNNPGLAPVSSAPQHQFPQASTAAPSPDATGFIPQQPNQATAQQPTVVSSPPLPDPIVAQPAAKKPKKLTLIILGIAAVVVIVAAVVLAIALTNRPSENSNSDNQVNDTNSSSANNSKNQEDDMRRNNVAFLTEAVTAYVANRNQLPQSFSDIKSYVESDSGSYLDYDPSRITNETVIFTDDAPADKVLDKFYIVTGKQCDTDSNSVVDSSSKRAAAILTLNESSGNFYCHDV